MKKLFLISGMILSAFMSSATIHIVRVWDGYFQFVDAATQTPNTTIQLGDTVHWLPLDQPAMVHTITSTNIPGGSIAFNKIWQAPADTFFQYIPLVAGLYEYECTPHVALGMIGSITVQNSTSSTQGALPEQEGFSIYPNPVTNFIQLNESIPFSDFRINDANGNTLLSGKTETEIDVSSFAIGIYFLELVSDRKRTVKFIKH